MNADRNLLLGILALQNNFINRQQLLAAFDEWTSDKSQSLGQILEQQHAITADRRLLLEALMTEHLKLHDNDPERSLADLTPVGSVHDELKRLGDVDVEASLAHVSRARDDDPNATQPWSVGESTSAGTRFRVLRPHARGGLGEVYVARDEELHREVALKEIQERHAHDANSRSRFLMEAEITGGLEHPGVVPVYGLGTYADGRPFYAMRFIKGDSLKDAIKRFHRVLPLPPGEGRDEGGLPQAPAQPQETSPTRRNRLARDAFSSLEFRKLLGRFIDVCNAIEYAHSRGVLHRDLKPGNIMLGKYGETLVVDWGLAKVVGRPETRGETEERTLQPSSGSDSASTQMGSAVGTPQYMSPEQAEGRLDELGPTSDVYSLGATFYTLLTGKPPFSSTDLGAILAHVAKGDFPPLRTVNADIPRALEAICLKAMSLRAAHRYASPRLMADDIEHWLADEPVMALPEPMHHRAGRWLRRHRAWAQSGIAALILVSVVSTFAAIGINSARRDARLAERGAKNQATRARLAEANALRNENRAKEAAEIAKHQKELAQRSADDARRSAAEELQQRKQARNIVTFLEYLFKGAHPLEFSGAPGGGREDAASLTTRDLLDRGRQFIKMDRYPPREQAVMLDTLGDVERGLANYDAAERMLHEAKELRERELAPDDPDHALSLYHLGRLHYDKGDFEAAEPMLRKALEMARTRSGNNDARVADIELSLGWLRVSQMDMAEAESLFRDALDIRLANFNESTPDVASARMVLAAITFTRGKRPEGLQGAIQVVRDLQTLLREGMATPGGDKFLPALVTYMNAYNARKQRNFDLSAKLYRGALEAAREFLGRGHFIVLLLEGDFAHMYLEKADFEAYVPMMRGVLARARRSPLAGHPEMIKAMLTMADYLRSRGELEEAEKLYREILDYDQRRKRPRNRAAIDGLVTIFRQKGRNAEADALLAPNGGD